jgi:hypothetical protein
VSVPHRRLFIGGRFVDATSGETFETLNPATGEVVAVVDHAGDGDVDRAVQAAREAFRDWAGMTGSERGRILHRAASLLRERNDELALLEVSDTGKPISEASTVDVISGAECIEYYAGVAGSLHGHHYDFGVTSHTPGASPSGWWRASVRGTTRSRSRAGSRPLPSHAGTRWSSSPPNSLRSPRSRWRRSTRRRACPTGCSMSSRAMPAPAER